MDLNSWGILVYSYPDHSCFKGRQLQGLRDTKRFVNNRASIAVRFAADQMIKIDWLAAVLAVFLH